jgi:hypothetical protein
MSGKKKKKLPRGTRKEPDTSRYRGALPADMVALRRRIVWELRLLGYSVTQIVEFLTGDSRFSHLKNLKALVVRDIHQVVKMFYEDIRRMASLHSVLTINRLELALQKLSEAFKEAEPWAVKEWVKCVVELAKITGDYAPIKVQMVKDRLESISAEELKRLMGEEGVMALEAQLQRNGEVEQEVE